MVCLNIIVNAARGRKSAVTVTVFFRYRTIGMLDSNSAYLLTNSKACMKRCYQTSLPFHIEQVSDSNVGPNTYCPD